MTEQEIKDLIYNIIVEADDYIIADEIYGSLIDQVDPGRTQEKIRRYIREMVNSGEYLIGSSSNGYFKITSREQALNAIQYLESRIPELQTRADRIKQEWNNLNPDNRI